MRKDKILDIKWWSWGDSHMVGKSRLFIEPPAFRMPSERSSTNPQPHLKIKNINSALSDTF